MEEPSECCDEGETTIHRLGVEPPNDQSKYKCNQVNEVHQFQS